MTDDPFTSGRAGTSDILGGYTARADLLNSQAQMQREDAMQLLSRALNNAPQVSTEQGIAAALLAAIPTLGGALIGKAVGSTKIPQGMYGLKGISPGGMSAGGAMGAEIGNNASQDFLKRLDRTAQTTPILKEMADVRNQQAQQTAQQANAVENARLSAETDINMIPLREQSQMRIQSQAAANSYENQRRLEELRNSSEALPPELLVKENLTQDDLKGLSASQVRALTNWKEANRREKGQDIRLSGENLVPPSTQTKQKMDNVLLTKQVGDRYIQQFTNLAANDPSWLSRNVEAALPATELGALQQALGLFAVQVRNARETGVMTEQDYQRYSDYLQLKPLDTMGSVLGRMKELQSVTDLSAKSTLMAAKAGRENVSSYEELFGYNAPTSLNAMVTTPGAAASATPTAAPGVVPQVGGMFEGKKVLSVKKVR